MTESVRGDNMADLVISSPGKSTGCYVVTAVKGVQ